MKNLHWTKEGNRYYLKNKEEVLIDLVHSVSGNDTFSINYRHYSIIRKGFWTPHYQVMFNDEKILQLTFSAWSSIGKIVFSDGSAYSLDYKSTNGPKMRFLDHEKEILSYGLNQKDIKNQNISFQVGIVMEDAEKLLILAALGISVFSCFYNGMLSDDDILLLSV